MPDQREDAATQFLRDVGEKLRRAREAKKLSLRAVGARISKSHGAVGHWETGHNPIDLATLFTLARLYDTPVVSLIADKLTDADTVALVARQLEQRAQVVVVPTFGEPARVRKARSPHSKATDPVKKKGAK
jgi:transcriptional regulator with XRE-family HTH domain